MKTIIAKEDFLWYKKGQEIPEKDYHTNWSHLVAITESNNPVVGVEAVKPVEQPQITKPSIFNKVKKSIK